MEPDRRERAEIGLNSRHAPEFGTPGIAAVFQHERTRDGTDIAQFVNLGCARKFQCEPEDIAPVRVGIGAKGQAGLAALFQHRFGNSGYVVPDAACNFDEEDPRAGRGRRYRCQGALYPVDDLEALDALPAGIACLI